MSNLPTGNITFLFTDIEGSTQLWEKYPEEMKDALAKHDSILHEAIESNNGVYLKTTGDGCHAVFANPLDSIKAMIAAQHNFKEPLNDVQIKVRMGVHTGGAELRGNDYYGQALNRTARLMSVGHGGQILLSATTAELIRNQLAEGIALVDLGEHRLKDLIKSEHIFQIAAPDLVKEFDALKSLSNFPNNLPLQLTSFIGREKEIQEAKKRLTTARLLTLIGPGGTGKTRLSLQIGAELLATYADGIWFIELAPLADPTLILQTLASVLGVREQFGMPLNQIVFDYLRAKNLLIILDNCEHLVDACAQLTEQLLQACPQIKVIASSREALGLNGETVYRVPSFSTPDPARATFESLTQNEAVQLFMERASAANPKFNLNEKNAASIAQICRRLDGIPLALELAAARATVFSAEQIASRLDDRFKLLTGGSRTALPRQQTLRALIDWSYDILSEEERELLRRLSVFAGGWSYEAAEFVCPKHDVLNLLTQLVNKSLVTVDDESGETRYRLLETIRQYARDKLLDADESEEVRNTHAEYFLQFVENAETKLFTAESIFWVQLLNVEYDNIRAALEWTIDNNIEYALRIVWSLQLFWNRNGLETEGRTWGEVVVAREASLQQPEGEAGLNRKKLRGYALCTIASLAISQGDNDYADLVSEKGTEIARQIGDKPLLVRSLTFSAPGRIVTGDISGLEAKLEEAIAVSIEINDKFMIGMAKGLMSEILLMTGKDPEIMQQYAAEGKKFLKESGNQWGFCMVVLGIGMISKYKGQFDQAREQFSVILPMFKDLGDMHRVNMIQSEFAHIERFEGHVEKAAEMYCGTIVEWQRLGHRAAVANQLECMAFIAKLHEQGERAVTLLGAAELLREKINIPMSQFERVEYDQQIADLKSGLGEQAFNSTWAQGYAMTMEQAIELALRESA